MRADRPPEVAAGSRWRRRRSSRLVVEGPTLPEDRSALDERRLA